MNKFLEVVQTISTLDKARDEAIKEKEAAQKDLEKLFADYLYCLFNGLAPITDICVQMIERHNNGIRVFLDFQVETFEKSSNMLKDLIIKQSSDEELEKGLDEVDKMLKELNKRAKDFFG